MGTVILQIDIKSTDFRDWSDLGLTLLPCLISIPSRPFPPASKQALLAPIYKKCPSWPLLLCYFLTVLPTLPSRSAQISHISHQQLPMEPDPIDTFGDSSSSPLQWHLIQGTVLSFQKHCSLLGPRKPTLLWLFSYLSGHSLPCPFAGSTSTYLPTSGSSLGPFLTSLFLPYKFSSI